MASEDRFLELFDTWQKCQGCELHKTRRHVLFGDGAFPASVVAIVEAPGDAEERAGAVLVGGAEHVFWTVAEEEGLPFRQSLFLTGVLACRPPGKPQPHHVEPCRERVHATLALFQPKVVLLLGSIASIAYGGYKGGVKQNRGRPGTVAFSYDGVDYSFPCLPTYHPSYLLRSSVKEAEVNLFRADLTAAARMAGLLEGAA